MSWLRRILRSAPPAHRVVIPDDVAMALCLEGGALPVEVERILRDHMAAADAPEVHVDHDIERLPFWLRRDDDQADIDGELRDRISLRHAGEAESRA